MRDIGKNLPLDRLPPGTTFEVRSELEEWIVREAYACTEPHAGAESYHWTEYRLQERESDATAWLSVEFDEGAWEAVLFTRQIGLDEVGYRRGEEFPDEFVLDGEAYSLDESGKLEATKVGSTISYRGQYADYVRGDGQVLSIEAYPDPSNTPRETDVEIWVGRIVEPRSLEINVADPAEAPHLVPQALPNAELERAGPRSASGTSESLRRLMSDPAQRNTRMLVIGGVVVVLVILLLISL